MGYTSIHRIRSTMRVNNKFVFTEQPHTTNINVWYDGILIGELFFSIRESPNKDWPKYRADKQLKLSFEDRWISSWKAYTTANMITVGRFENKEEAAEQILHAHRKKFNESRGFSKKK